MEFSFPDTWAGAGYDRPGYASVPRAPLVIIKDTLPHIDKIRFFTLTVQISLD